MIRRKFLVSIGLFSRGRHSQPIAPNPVLSVTYDDVRGSSPETRYERYLILSCDGGGVRGLLTALILWRLHQDFRLLDRVDLFAGTSTGGIIALGLAGDVPIDTIVDLYQSQAKLRTIFQPFEPLDNERMQIGGDPDSKMIAEVIHKAAKAATALLHPLYDNLGLEDVLRGVFKTDPTLASLGSGKRVLVTTLQLQPGPDRTWSPVTLHNFPTDEARPDPAEIRPDETHVVEAAMCASAIPIYFPPYRHSRLGYCIDGALYANNPGSLALAKVIRSGQSLESIRMLSVGTGGTSHSMRIPHHPAFQDGAQLWDPCLALPRSGRADPSVPLASRHDGGGLGSRQPSLSTTPSRSLPAQSRRPCASRSASMNTIKSFSSGPRRSTCSKVPYGSRSRIGSGRSSSSREILGVAVAADAVGEFSRDGEGSGFPLRSVLHLTLTRTDRPPLRIWPKPGEAVISHHLCVVHKITGAYVAFDRRRVRRNGRLLRPAPHNWFGHIIAANSSSATGPVRNPARDALILLR